MRRNKNQIKAAKIADAVLWAVNSGRKVVPMGFKSDGSCCCPLGAVRLSPSTKGLMLKMAYPSGNSADMTESETEHFIRAFDNGIETISFWSHLGILYRRWSQRKYGWTE